MSSFDLPNRLALVRRISSCLVVDYCHCISPQYAIHGLGYTIYFDIFCDIVYFVLSLFRLGHGNTLFSLVGISTLKGLKAQMPMTK